MINLLIREGRPAEILLVEDNRGDAILAGRAFKEARIANNLTVADTGEAALSILRGEGDWSGRRLPDIVLLDLNLPRMNGLEVLKIIKSDEALKHIPVIVLSSSSASQDVSTSYAQYASGYIMKPVDLDKFRDVVAAIEQFFFVLSIIPVAEAG
jgi:two-component system, chemotaxis family, response regulator Rcp1